MLQMVEKSSSEKLRDIFDIKIKMPSEKAKELLLKGELPNNVEVDGDLVLEGTKITSMLEGLSVGGRLDLQNTKITSLPKGLQVGGWLDLRYTEITSLPEGLQVGWDVWVSKKLKGKINKPKGVNGKIRYRL